jgi:hypothetical protein
VVERLAGQMRYEASAKIVKAPIQYSGLADAAVDFPLQSRVVVERHFSRRLSADAREHEALAEVARNRTQEVAGRPR